MGFRDTCAKPSRIGCGRAFYIENLMSRLRLGRSKG